MGSSTNPPTVNEATSPQEAYAVFCGQITEETASKLAACISTATVKLQNVHLLFQSSGGSVGDGVFLYNLFKGLPICLTIYNVRSVCSIAVIAYMGAPRRIVSPRATFMIHRTTAKLARAPAMIMRGVTKSLILEGERAESILRANIRLPEGERWSNLDQYDFYFSGKEAVDIGLAHELGEFSLPPGTPVYYFS